VRRESPAVAGLHISAIPISFGLTSVLGGRVIARYGTRAALLTGLVALVASAWSAAALSSTAPFLELAPALVLMGAGAGFVAPAANAAILASVPESLSGIGSGVLNVSRQVGTALGVAVFASLFHGGAREAVRLALVASGVIYGAAFAVVALATRPALQPAAPAAD
jgi:DHA2 family methylenomycin A resistance protein-like MFS transporter